MTDVAGKSRFSFFVESPAGLKAYLEVHLSDLPPDVTLLEEFERTATKLAAKGFKRDTSFDKPVGGWSGGGGKAGGRKDDAPPADLPVPTHCDAPMIYKAEWTNKDGVKRGARFQCAATPCKDPDIGGDGKEWPGSIWEDAYRKRLGIPRGGAQGAAEPAKAAPAVLTYGVFLNTALGTLGYNKAQLLKAAHTNEDELKNLGPAGWQQLLDDLASASNPREAV